MLDAFQQAAIKLLTIMALLYVISRPSILLSIVKGFGTTVGGSLKFFVTCGCLGGKKGYEKVPKGDV